MLVVAEVEPRGIQQQLHLGKVCRHLSPHRRASRQIDVFRDAIRVIHHAVPDDRERMRGARWPDLIEYKPHDENTETDAEHAIARWRNLVDRAESSDIREKKCKRERAAKSAPSAAEMLLADPLTPARAVPTADSSVAMRRRSSSI